MSDNTIDARAHDIREYVEPLYIPDESDDDLDRIGIKICDNKVLASYNINIPTGWTIARRYSQFYPSVFIFDENGHCRATTDTWSTGTVEHDGYELEVKVKRRYEYTTETGWSENTRRGHWLVIDNRDGILLAYNIEDAETAQKWLDEHYPDHQNPAAYW